jgi:D-lactate dehydrogenase
MKQKVAFFDARPVDEKVFTAAFANDMQLTFSPQPVSEATIQAAAGAAILSVHVTSQVTKSIMASLPDLKHIACRTTGFDNIDLQYAQEQGISISTVPAYGQDTVAEYAFLLAQAVSRKLPQALAAASTHRVVPADLTGTELNGKTIGVIGTGRIGQRAAAIGRGFGMEVLAYDPFPNDSAARKYGFIYTSLDDLLMRADVVTLHAPATPENQHMIGPTQFNRLKQGAILVNTARGSLIDTAALVEALQSGRVAGAGLDVVEGEEVLEVGAEVALQQGVAARQIEDIARLQKLPNVLITSHNAYNSVEALQRIRQTTIDNIKAWMGGEQQNVVEVANK